MSSKSPLSAELDQINCVLDILQPILTFYTEHEELQSLTLLPESIRGSEQFQALVENSSERFSA